jgi:hypothetical protein
MVALSVAVMLANIKQALLQNVRDYEDLRVQQSNKQEKVV